MILLMESNSFRDWKIQWQSHPISWWRIPLVLLSYLIGLVAVAFFFKLVLIPWIKANWGKPEALAQELVGLTLLGIAFLCALLAMDWSKRKLHGDAPSLLASSKTLFRPVEALISGLIWFALFFVGVLLISRQELFERLEAYSTSEWLVLIMVALVTVSVQASSEEVVFRGYLIPALASRMNLFFAVFISCLIFTIGHPGSGLLGTTAVLLFSIVFSLSVLRSATISYAAGAHIANNFCQILLFPSNSNADGTLEELWVLSISLVIWIVWVNYSVRKNGLTQGKSPIEA